MGPEQAVDLLKKVDDDEEGDEGGQAQTREFEKLPGYVGFQDAGAPEGAGGISMPLDISESRPVFILI